VDVLREVGSSVVTAESCTGGLIAAVLSCAQGAGECLHGGFVVYTKAQKHRVLGVSRALLARRGSVNAEVALQMAQGALARTDARVAIAVTGVLGADADEDGNPAGLIYLGIAQRGSGARAIEECIPRHGPDEVRRRVVLRALELLRSLA
jgi:nicotinamide-nucleotide amidase